MTSYVDREDDVIAYYPTREAAMADLASHLRLGDEGWREPYQRQNASALIHGVTPAGRNKVDRRGRELEATDSEIDTYLASKVRESRKRPGQFYVIYPK